MSPLNRSTPSPFIDLLQRLDQFQYRGSFMCRYSTSNGHQAATLVHTGRVSRFIKPARHGFKEPSLRHWYVQGGRNCSKVIIA